MDTKLLFFAPKWFSWTYFLKKNTVRGACRVIPEVTLDQYWLREAILFYTLRDWKWKIIEFAFKWAIDDANPLRNKEVIGNWRSGDTYNAVHFVLRKCILFSNGVFLNFQSYFWVLTKILALTKSRGKVRKNSDWE